MCNFFCVFLERSGGVNFCRCERGRCRCGGGHSEMSVPNIVLERILGLGKNCLGKNCLGK